MITLTEKETTTLHCCRCKKDFQINKSCELLYSISFARWKCSDYLCDDCFNRLRLFLNSKNSVTGNKTQDLSDHINRAVKYMYESRDMMIHSLTKSKDESAEQNYRKMRDDDVKSTQFIDGMIVALSELTGKEYRYTRNGLEECDD